ncbi:MAG TPA: MBL fold metallo-hydrolase [Actinocrinis sp.]|nr:MBL fold metallo-hydrolase [Actinocrinis sp.]
MAERDWEEVADGVVRKRFEPCDVTVTAVVGSEGVAVVDTRCSLAEAREIKDQLKRLTSAPLRWVVNTHAHFDHCWGNAEFVEPRLTPPARIWGHASVPARLDPENPVLQDRIARLAAEGPQWTEKIAELEFSAPTELVRDQASIDLGDRALELRFLGRGHTDGDLLITVAAGATKVVLTGDLVEESGPPAFGKDSFPLEWADTLDRALPLISSDTRVIPGHGAVVDAAFVRAQRDAIALVAAEIRRLHAAGVPVESAAEEGTWAIEAKALRSAIERGYAALA